MSRSRFLHTLAVIGIAFLFAVSVSFIAHAQFPESYFYTQPLAFRVKLLDMLHNLSSSPSDRQKKKYQTAIKGIANVYLDDNLSKSPLGISKQHWQMLLNVAGLGTNNKTLEEQMYGTPKKQNIVLNFINDWIDINQKEIFDFIADEIEATGNLPSGDKLFKHFHVFMADDLRNGPIDGGAIADEVVQDYFESVTVPNWGPNMLMKAGNLFNQFMKNNSHEIENLVALDDPDQYDPMEFEDPDRYFGVSKYD